MFLETMFLLASEPHQEPENEKSVFAVLPPGTAWYSPEHTPPAFTQITSIRRNKQKFQIV
jgi:hypothetical protein